MKAKTTVNKAEIMDYKRLMNMSQDQLHLPNQTFTSLIHLNNKDKYREIEKDIFNQKHKSEGIKNKSYIYKGNFIDSICNEVANY